MAKREIDWQSIEREYRAGVKSVNQISKDYGVSDTAIAKNADKYNWTRDLAAVIRAKAAEKVLAQQVGTSQVGSELEDDKALEQRVIEENATIQANVIREHRTYVKKAQAITQMLFEELERSVINAEELARFAEIRATVGSAETGDAEVNERLLAFYTKIMELPQKAGVIDKLANSLGKLISLERQAFNIDDTQSAGQTLESFLAQLD